MSRAPVPVEDDDDDNDDDDSNNNNPKFKFILGSEACSNKRRVSTTSLVLQEFFCFIS